MDKMIYLNKPIVGKRYYGNLVKEINIKDVKIEDDKFDYGDCLVVFNKDGLVINAVCIKEK